MTEDTQRLRVLPSVGEMLNRRSVVALCEEFGRPLVTSAIRRVIDRHRAAIRQGAQPPDEPTIIADAGQLARDISTGSLRPVINASGVVLHTNLGRAPLGEAVVREIAQIVQGYCNLEFDLKTARRDNRNAHVAELLKYLISAEEAIVVNNNAAGIVLALSTLAAGREVVISRGELIEIGGSFRIPEIMKASGAILVEVGATNRTRLADYEAAIGPETALILKAHKSNYSIRGFTEETSVRQLSELARARKLPLAYDIGSGLLRKPEGLPLEHEPDVRGAIADGADLVMFSCDKLLGGPQAGIVAGRAELIRRLAAAPLMRAMRVGKLTLAALSAACRHYLNDEALLKSNPTFALLQRPLDEKKRLARQLLGALADTGVEARVIETVGQCGGGTLPDVELPSAAVELLPKRAGADRKSAFAERVFRRLLEAQPPVLAILREGRLLLDVLALAPQDPGPIARAVAKAVQKEARP